MKFKAFVMALFVGHNNKLFQYVANSTTDSTDAACSLAAPIGKGDCNPLCRLRWSICCSLINLRCYFYAPIQKCMCWWSARGYSLCMNTILKLTQQLHKRKWQQVTTYFCGLGRPIQLKGERHGGRSKHIFASVGNQPSLCYLLIELHPHTFIYQYIFIYI